MIENRTARNEAWIASLVLHVALLAGVVAVIGRPSESAVGPVVVDTRLSGHEIGVVLLDRPIAGSHPAADGRAGAPRIPAGASRATHNRSAAATDHPANNTSGNSAHKKHSTQRWTRIRA